MVYVISWMIERARGGRRFTEAKAGQCAPKAGRVAL